TLESFEDETADRAVDAIQSIMRTRYRAIVLDLKLPGLGGLDAISVIKRLDDRLPIIVMTGHASYETEQAARAAGIFYYLVKPFALRELTDAVKAAVRARVAGKTRGWAAPVGSPRGPRARSRPRCSWSARPPGGARGRAR